MDSIEGLLPAALTPMKQGGDLDLDIVGTQASYFKDVGAAGVFINGTSGEWTSLTVEERKSLTSEWGRQADEGFFVVDHVGHHCQRDGISLAKHAADSGVHAISVVAPSYFPMESAQDIVDWCAPIASAADGLPFIYYDLPQLTGVSVPAFEVALEAKERIPTFSGIKYSGIDPVGLQRCIAQGGYQVFWGSDESLLVGLSLGCKAAVGSTYNLMIPLYKRIISAYHAGDLESARRLQHLSLRAVESMIPHGVIPSLKALQTLTGYTLGACRPPFRQVSAADSIQLSEDILALGVIEP